MSEHFLGLLQRQFDENLKTDALFAVREKSWQQLLKLGLPSKSDESFRYLSLRDLYTSSFETVKSHSLEKSVIEKSVIPECRHSHIVFVDGRFSPDLSDISALPPQAILLPLSLAMRSHSGFLQKHFSRLLKDEKDPFAILNLSLHPEGIFFFLPPKMHAQVPIQCMHFLTGSMQQSAFPRSCLALGAHSQMQWIMTYHPIHAEVCHLLMPSTEVSLEEGAHLNLLNCVDAMPSSWHLESLRATLKKNARFDSLSVTTGAKTVRQSYRVQLKGEQSLANLNGLCMLGKNRSAHTHATVDHEAPHTRSMQLFKGVLNDISQSSFEGKIIVRSEAQKTEAYQLNNNLILNQGAIVNSKPNLEVFADDVKASHGATISQLDEEQLFYLNTRGICESEARGLLIGGFCREMIDQIPYSSILKKMHSHIESVVNRG